MSIMEWFMEVSPFMDTIMKFIEYYRMIWITLFTIPVVYYAIRIYYEDSDDEPNELGDPQAHDFLPSVRSTCREIFAKIKKLRGSSDEDDEQECPLTDEEILQDIKEQMETFRFTARTVHYNQYQGFQARSVARRPMLLVAPAGELMRIVECYSKYEHHGQTMVMIIMSHGLKFLSDDVILPSDFRMSRPSELFHRGIPLAWIVSRFSDKNCPSLRDKPKVFIVQACRAHNYNPGKIPGNWNTILKEKLFKKGWPLPVHCAIFKSCVEGMSSFRHVKEGTRFINSFIEAIQKYAYKHNLAQIFQQVRR
ncbi:unnamed protein product [Cyprideis torosa]|uniref:Uncharacterized protein n=1 Tax=Cyprideis torosa TaxID=163714 RepID=A0A7R8WJ24_9CRUS|nr:unnamed protein product [Cyprideis torosa]CAG0894757.1 unnamed protein product [Cyprideis torosa]